jgi:hypothetical protein
MEVSMKIELLLISTSIVSYTGILGYRLYCLPHNMSVNYAF